MGETAMRLSDIAQLVGRRGATSYLCKHGKHELEGLALGIQLPGIIDRGVERYNTTERALNRATGKTIAKHADWGSFMGGMGGAGDTPGQMGSSLGGKTLFSMISPILGAPGSAIGQRIQNAINPQPGLMDKVKEKALGTAFGALGTAGVDLLKDLASKAVAAVSNISSNSAREAILKSLKKEDIVLADADDKMLMESYHTMVRFAPTLSTDKNAVRSFLRQAVIAGSGPDFTSIKLLADSERAVTGGNKKD